jgi:hypothetical protein
MFYSEPLRLEYKFASAAEGVIEGYASTFGVRDYQGHSIDKGAFFDTLTNHTAQGTAPAMLWAHDLSRPVGSWTSLAEDGVGLLATGRINLESAEGREAFAHVKGGSSRGLSIGYTALPGTTRIENNAIHFSQVDVFEVSLTPVPANPQARITGVKSISSAGEFEEMMRGNGLSRSDAKKATAGGWRGLAGNQDDDDDKLIMALIKRSAQRWKDF